MFSLLLFFVAAMSVQTVQAQSNGDVNGDGVVDEKDITAILKIMAEAGGVKKKAKYYWYVGQENPASMTSISPIVTDTSSPGWRLIGTSIPAYSSTNKLYDPDKNLIITGTTLKVNYIVLPENCNACLRDGIGNDGTTVNLTQQLNSITLEGVKYKVYQTVGKSKKIGYPIY